MPQTELGKLGLRGLVPRSLGARPAVALERALGEPFVAAVDEAFESLADVDPGAVWVLKRLDVHMAVPASEPDALVQSRRVAAGLAQAVRKAVAAGPSTEAVRFTSRADYVASFVRARAAGHSGSWVFDRFASIAALAAVDALPAAARIAEVDLIDVVRELAVRAGWTRLLAMSSPVEFERLAASIARRLEGAVAPAEALAVVAAARSRRLALAAAGTSAQPRAGARARLELLAELAETQPVDLGLLAAIWRLEPEAPAEMSPSAWRARWSPGVPDDWAERGVPGELSAPLPAPRAEPEGPLIFAAAGAPAFMLLSDLEVLLADEPLLAAATPVAASVRSIVLAGVFGDRLDEDDPAIALAAGVAQPPEPTEWDAFLTGPVAAWAERLAADSVLGWLHPLDEEWVARATERSSALGIASIVLLRSFTRHLAGFGRARASHVVPQVLPTGGIVRVDDGLIEAVLPSGPLHVLLALGGLDAFAYRVPWLPARIVVGHEVAS